MKSICIKEGDVEYWVLESSCGMKFRRPYDNPNVWIIQAGADAGLTVSRHGIVHRIGGPAYTNPTTGTVIYCVNGRPHRLDGPAIIFSGIESWHKHGRFHRTGGPSYTTPERTEWHQNGKFHRDGAPAISSCIFNEHKTQWYENGKRHRLDGPAILVVNEKNPEEVIHESYYVNDVNYYAGNDYREAVARWLSYKDVTQEEINFLIGKFKIVEWK